MAPDLTSSTPPSSPIADSAAQPAIPASRRRVWIRSAAAIAIAAATAAALHVTGTLAATGATLQVMGFDPDRARLIADLVGAAIATAAATLVAGALATSGIAGMAAGLVLFGSTFVHETRAALRATGPAGTFDPLGWGLTGATLLVAFAVVAWATVVLAGIVRRWLLDARSDLAAMRSPRRSPRLLRRPGAIVVGAGLLAVTLPVFADMVNYSPDAHMRGGRQGVALTQEAPTAPAPTNVVESARLVMPSGGPSGGETSVIRQGAPWTAWQPTGQGQLLAFTQPAPWTGGTKSVAGVEVYLPPGYSTSTRSYPVVYAVPWQSSLWTTGANLTTMLDSMITSGQFPASIVVFVAQEGGPYPSSECANAVDGREWYETYLTTTIVPYIDATYRTVRSAAARSVLGFSQGAFCSTMLVLRHPDLFSTAIALSGYYEAGVASNQTPNAFRPFGGNPAVEAQYSPIRLVGQLPAAERSKLLLVLEGDPSDPFYGAQFTSMVEAARAAGVPVWAVQSPSGHGWPTVRDHLPPMLEILAKHQNALGVFA